jgi:hypothetical protein
MVFLRSRSRLWTEATCQLNVLVFLVVLQLTSIRVLASVYPTKPIADTVFTSGNYEQIEWRDDGRAPHIKDMGLMSIDLYATSVVLTTITEVSGLHSAWNVLLWMRRGHVPICDRLSLMKRPC